MAQDINTYMKTMIHRFISTLHTVIDQLEHLFPEGHLFFGSPLPSVLQMRKLQPRN